MRRATPLSLLITLGLLGGLLIVNVFVASPHEMMTGFSGVGSGANGADLALRTSLDSRDLAGVRRAIANGASVNRRDIGGWSPLTRAASVGDVEICAELLGHGAAVDGHMKEETPPIVNAAMYGYGEVVDLLIRHGADVNARSASGSTPLYVAAACAHHAVADALIRAGADVNAANALGVTPLMAATDANSAAMVEVLRAAGAAPGDDADDQGDSAAQVASRRGSRATFVMLRHRGRDTGFIRVLRIRHECL